jgi:hypothetical protein
VISALRRGTIGGMAEVGSTAGAADHGTRAGP